MNGFTSIMGRWKLPFDPIERQYCMRLFIKLRVKNIQFMQ